MELDHYNSFVRDLDDLEVFNNFMSDQVVKNLRCVVKPATNSTLAKVPKPRRKRFNPLQELSEHEFKESYRYSKENALKLIEIIRDDLEVERPAGMRLSTSNQVPVEMQVLIAIRRWGTNELPELIAHQHEVSTHTLEKICRRVAAAFASKASRYIRMPATLAEKEQVTKNFQAIAAFPQVIGAVACQAIRLKRLTKPEQQQQDTLANNIGAARHCEECTMNMQIISDASFKIRDFDYRLRPLSKSCHNQQIFPETRIKERFEQHEFRGRLLLGDANYMCTSYLLTPVAVSQQQSTKDYLFNKAHSCTQATVRKCLQMWRTRFRIMQGDELACLTFSGAKHLIVALAVLHNIGIDLNDACTEFTHDFGLHDFVPDAIFIEDANPEDNTEKNGVDFRSAFISKNF